MSVELIARLNEYPKMRAVLERLPPKVLSISSDAPTQVVALESASLEDRVEMVKRGIQAATFTGKGDAEKVPALYMDEATGITIALFGN